MNKKIVKKIFFVLFFILVMALAIYVVFNDQDPAQILAAIRQFDAVWLIPAALFGLGYVCCEGVMIHFMIGGKGGLREMIRCISYAFVGFFFSGITPSASGGQPMQLVYMSRDGHRFSESCATLTVIAVFNKLVLAAAGVLLLIFWHDPLIPLFGSNMGIYALGLAVLVFWVVFLGMLMLFPSTVEKAALGIVHLVEKTRILKPSEKRDAAIRTFFDGYRTIKKTVFENRAKLLFIAFFSVLQRALLVFLTCFVYIGFHLEGTSLMYIFLLQLAVMVTVDMLPLPGAQGISETLYTAVFGGVFGTLFLRPSVCVSRLLSFYLPLLTGMIVSGLLSLMKKKQDRAIETK